MVIKYENISSSLKVYIRLFAVYTFAFYYNMLLHSVFCATFHKNGNLRGIPRKKKCEW